MRTADFGPLVVETDIDVAICEQMVLWFPTHLAQIERERGLKSHFLRRPKKESFANTLDEDEFLDHTLPAIIVTTSATVGDPVKDSDGKYFAAWNVVISAVCRGRASAETRYLAALYGGAVKRIMVGMPDINGHASETRWMAGNVAPVRDSTRRGRYLAASINQFLVYVDDVLQEGAGPVLPNPDDNPYDPADPADPDTPYDPLEVVRAVSVQVTALPIEQE